MVKVNFITTIHELNLFGNKKYSFISNINTNNNGGMSVHLRYYVYEICSNVTLKKTSIRNFETKEEAEKEIIRSWHPLDRKKLIAFKVHC